MIWLMAAHIVSLVIWCAGLFYLPGLFAAHAGVPDEPAFRRLRAMTRFTFIAVASPAAIVAIVTGSALVVMSELVGPWLALKLVPVTGLVLFHAYCGRMLALLGTAPRSRSPRALRALAVVPALLIALVLWLVLAKPV